MWFVHTIICIYNISIVPFCAYDGKLPIKFEDLKSCDIFIDDIIETINEEDYVWVSADGVYLVTNNGKIIQSYGLINNLKEKLSPSLNWDENLYENKEFISYNSFDPPALNNLKVISKYTNKGKVNIELTFGTKNLNLIEEKISSNEIGWSGTNSYWVDENNFVWKSIQNISPKLPEISLEVTKKPR